jgi:hypothetical protein
MLHRSSFIGMGLMIDVYVPLRDCSKEAFINDKSNSAHSIFSSKNTRNAKYH